MKKLITALILSTFAVVACGQGSGNPNKPDDVQAGQGGKWGCYLDDPTTDKDLVVAKYKEFDLAISSCEDIKRGDPLNNYYVMGPDKVIHPIDITVDPLTINDLAFPSGTVGEVYPATTLTAEGGTGPYDWEIASGSLPPGLILTVDGTVQGTPLTEVGSPFIFRVAATDSAGVLSTKEFSIQVLSPGPNILTTTLPDGEEGVLYSAQVTAENGTAPLSFSVTSGALPPGLSMGPAGNISGTPTNITATNVYNFTVTVTDAELRTDSQALSITIVPALSPTITEGTLPLGDLGIPYNAQISYTSGTGVTTLSLASGSLPPGLSMSSTGSITGIPTEWAGSPYIFSVAAVDELSQTATGNFSITVRPGPPTITTTSLPNGVVGELYFVTINVSGDAGPFSFSSSGTLPPGLTLSSSTGEIQGEPTTTGQYTFSITVTDANLKSDTQQYTVFVDTPPFSIVTTSLPGARIGDQYNETLLAEGGEVPYTWSMWSGSLPPGLSLSSDGSITGTPTSLVGSPYMFQIRADDAGDKFDVVSYEITVAPATLNITTTTIPDGQVNSPYSMQLLVSGGVSPYTWSLVSGTLPPGLTLNTSGLLSGTPTSNPEPQYVFTVQVTDDVGSTDSVQLSMVVQDDPSSLPSATVTWTPPTEREDNTALPLEEIGGYVIYARPLGSGDYTGGDPIVPSEWDLSIDVPDATQNWVEFYNLPSGVWVFAAVCYDTEGRVSVGSLPASKEVIE